MDDRELLEMAAKAAGIELEYCPDSGFHWVTNRYSGIWWNPLHIDGDAFRLACELKLDIEIFKCETIVTEGLIGSAETSEYDINADRAPRTRRAIVRAAAEIGRKMP